MNQTYINELKNHIGEEVTLKGWLYNSRSSGKLVFLQLRDGTGIVQCVVFKPNNEELFESAKSLGQESSIIVNGTVKEDTRSAIGVELDVTGLEIIQNSSEYPITPKEHGTEFLMDNRHLWIRSRKQHAVLKVRHTVIKATRDYFDNNGFILADTPIFTPAACEGTTTLFEVDYFEDNKAYLTQSGQLYNEATAAAFGKSYAFGPTFRAEKSKTRRHLTEFWMVEPEVAYNDSDANMRLQEEFVGYLVGRTLERRQEELKELERDLAPLHRVQPPFPRISYTDAVARLNALGSDMAWGNDLGGDDETLLAREYDRPVFVYNYPKHVKAFYMRENPADPRTVLNNDCLAPEGYGEIIGGSQREDNYEKLLSRIQEQGLDPEAYRWYLDLRKYGTFVHSGFGLGIERTVAWICGIPHIREAIAFPRQIHRLYP